MEPNYLGLVLLFVFFFFSNWAGILLLCVRKYKTKCIQIKARMRADFNTSGRNPIDWVHKERCMRKVLPNYGRFGGRRRRWWNRCCRPVKEGVSNICLQFEGNCKYSREGQLGQLRLMCKSTTAGFFSSLHGLGFLCFYCLQPQFFLFKTQEMSLITTFVYFVIKKKQQTFCSRH